MRAKNIFSFLLVFTTVLLCTAHALAEDVQIPAPAGDIYVQDTAHVLNETEKTELINIGRNLEDRTTAQVAVLTVQTIGDRPIEEYANEAFRQYGIGSKKEDNGVLLVLAMKEHKIRIEVGYGLEGRIPDAKAGRILDQYAIPYLKNNQPNQAVMGTYKALANEVLAEYNGGDGQKTVPQDEGIGIPSWLLIIIVLVVVVLDFKFFGGTLTYFLLSILSRGGGRGGGGGSRGGGGGSSGGGGASRGW
ncbi:TPM domain-containing protein [Bacillus sp. USDA818B3_A]|uniref:TPM domain-containing protein n=1 Tax=Bacillus sp. USDA818B3_A TaxID=2698834 RepID=UPI0013722855|nr:TPM domain-containing protein [Bacillus sp. USDA818B3_A]